MKTTLLALVACIPMNVFAIDYDWTNASGVDSNWLTPGNWTPAGPPTGGAGNFARFYNGATGPAQITADVPAVQDHLFGFNGTAGIRQVDHSAGTAVVTGWTRMGVVDGAQGLIAGNAGSYNLSGTGVHTTARLRVAEGNGSIAAFNVSGNGVANIAESLEVGNGGGTAIGTLTVSENGSVIYSQAAGTPDRRLLAGLNGSTANITVTGGLLRQNDVHLIDNNDTGWNRFGDNGVANVNLSGGMISLDARAIFGVGTGSATITQTGGIFEMRRGELTLGDSFGAMSATPNVNYNISAGTLRSLTNTGNADTSGNITVGQWDNSNAKLTISGTAIVRADQNIHIADGRVEFANKGEIEQTGGAVTYGRRLELARTPSGNGTYTLSGGTLTQDTVDPGNGENWNYIGRDGTANFNLSGTGVASFNARTHIGGGASVSATVTQTGGLLEVRNHELIIGDGGSAGGTQIYNISGGTVQTLSGGVISVGNWNNANAQLNVSGTGQVLASGDLNIGQVQNSTFISSGTVTQTGGLVRVQNNINMGLSENNLSTTSTGTYNLNGGVLDMTGGSINKGIGTANFNFGNGRLQDLANFNIGNLIQTDGILAPGAANAVGTTTINGNYSLQSDGEIEITITLAPAADVVTVNGTVTITGSLLMQDAAGLAEGLSFTILDNDGLDPLIGTFFGLPEGADFTTSAGNIFDISYVGGDGNDVRLLVVPEPVTGAMLLGATGLLVLLRRRRS